uniref:Phostensin/Taperin PP1-binding domain-containing protein n=1 Tax=Cyprinodon variegatus TaxID=28743 RepID=A0A3Q2DJK1_CYPVA
MSVSSLPEWKQLLLERKRREEEQRERREKEEEEKLASMPAWKRGIIQRRKAKQESLGDRDREVYTEAKPESQVSVETIVPVHENPFIRTQSVWRKGKDPESPSISPEGRTGGGKSREEGEMRSCLDLSRDMKLETSRLREKEKDRPWGQATVINKEDRGESCDDNVFIERGGRVSQLLSKFGGHPTPPSRSKSSDNFLQPGRRKYSGDQDDRQSEERKANGKNEILRSIPKRSFSFSDRVIGGAENGLGDVGGQGTTRPEKNIAPWVDVAGVTKLRPSYKERFGKQKDLKTEEEKTEETPERTSKESPQHLCTPTSQLKQTITINPSFVRNQSPENSLKPTNSAPTPASSPCSPSPANSPSISPSPSPSPKLFSIRSASGGQVKRGATITINPKKPQTMSPTVDESAKKRYPAVEEIEVIGGYQSLERSCLIKSKVTPKRVSFFSFRSLRSCQQLGLSLSDFSSCPQAESPFTRRTSPMIEKCDLREEAKLVKALSGTTAIKPCSDLLS